MPRPIIGVTCSVDAEGDSSPKPRAFLNMAYTDAIFAAGGLAQPVPIPERPDARLIAELIDSYDALLFTGGADVNPHQYGQIPHASTIAMHERRDVFEVEFFRAADAADKPILSICLGCQIASVARGGCLIQHVDDLPRKTAIEHHKPNHGTAYHDVEIATDSMLAKIVGRTRMEVNSRHHQVVDREQVGGSLKPVAFAPDGIVEAVEDQNKRFFLAVQWHPEDMIDRPEQLRLFAALVNAARKC
ncbi:MAG TPA: gamma-glutamyl-gamma-aminobutyrate hydrolase family protein [Phycisphaerae bacterium]|nr:gamma-glutamyl-gamma-aminobutyrate hydrolase family protein [Phycisphaerae bacterium]